MLEEEKTQDTTTEQEAPATSPEAATTDDLQDLKEQVADAYIGLIDKTKGWLFALAAEMGISANPLKGSAKEYLLGTGMKPQDMGFWEKIGNGLKQKLLGQANTQVATLSYDQKDLNAMKALLAKSSETELQNLLAMIAEGKDPTKEQSTDPNAAPLVAAAGAGAGIEMIDQPKRERVTSALDTILQEDEKTPIKYKWGSKDDVNGGLDCSGLIYHTVENAGLKMPAGDSRSLFKKLETQLIEVNPDKSIKDNLGNIARGDLIFRNSINPEYKWSAGEIPELTKDGKTYRIHHVAFVEKINYADGTIDIVESNGSQGVTKSTISVEDWLTSKEKHQSELYVSHVNYNTFDEQPKQQVV